MPAQDAVQSRCATTGRGSRTCGAFRLQSFSHWSLSRLATFTCGAKRAVTNSDRTARVRKLNTLSRGIHDPQSVEPAAGSKGDPRIRLGSGCAAMSDGIRSPWLSYIGVMRLGSYAYGGGLLLLVLIVAAAILSGSRVQPMGISVSVDSYQREGEEWFASLLLTNTGAVSLAVPLRFECQVDRVSGCTNYLIQTPYSLFLRPRDYVILSNVLWRVRLPADTSAWRVNVRFRQMKIGRAPV